MRHSSVIFVILCFNFLSWFLRKKNNKFFKCLWLRRQERSWWRGWRWWGSCNCFVWSLLFSSIQTLELLQKKMRMNWRKASEGLKEKMCDARNYTIAMKSDLDCVISLCRIQKGERRWSKPMMSRPWKTKLRLLSITKRWNERRGRWMQNNSREAHHQKNLEIEK
jgi:hypothetical protein